MVIYLALFMAIFGLLVKILREKTKHSLILLAPPIWVLLEFIRTYLFTGFPWSLLGYSQWQNTPLIQIASITGVYGVSFLIVMFNSAVYDFAFSKTKKSIGNLSLSILIIIMVIVFGRIAIYQEKESEKINIAVVQGNILQYIKWDEKQAEKIVNIYADLSIYASKENPSLIVWPETAYPDYFDINSELFKKIKNLIFYTETPILLGTVHEENGKDYNSALLIDAEGNVEEIYNKIHLVPFAEYIPFKKVFSFLEKTTPEIGNFSKGKEYTVFKIKNEKLKVKNEFAVLICFEDLFPDMARRFTSEGANFLINITNDAHFCESPALWQHFTHSVFRAIENRRPVIRAANNGISGFIDSYGRPVKILKEKEKATGIRSFANQEINTSSDETLYTQFGDLFVYLNILYLVILIIKINWRKYREVRK